MPKFVFFFPRARSQDFVIVVQFKAFLRFSFQLFRTSGVRSCEELGNNVDNNVAETFTLGPSIRLPNFHNQLKNIYINI